MQGFTWKSTVEHELTGIYSQVIALEIKHQKSNRSVEWSKLYFLLEGLGFQSGFSTLGARGIEEHHTSKMDT